MAVIVTWAPAFFSLEGVELVALGIVLLLWALVAATIAKFRRVDRRTAAPLVPYLARVSFAALPPSRAGG